MKIATQKHPGWDGSLSSTYESEKISKVEYTTHICTESGGESERDT